MNQHEDLTMISLLLLSSSLHAHALLLTAPPPPARQEPVVDVLQGEEIVDEYRWLESLESESEEVRSWTTLQNDYTREVLDNLPMRDRIEARIAELMTIGAVGAPDMAANRYFYRERKGDENQSILYVREGNDGEPRVLIDPNTLDEKGLYSLDWQQSSPDGSLLAFGLSYAGDEMTVLHVMDVESGEWLSDEIAGKTRMTGWLDDNRHFVYGTLDDPANAYSRSYYLHEVGRHHRRDPLIISQEDPSRVPYAYMTEDGRWIIIGVTEGWTQNDLYVADADHFMRTGEVKRTPIAVGLGERFEPQAVRGDTMYMLTTLGAPNGALYAVDLHNPARENWELLIPERADAVLTGVDEARGVLIASYEKDATSKFERFDFDGQSLGEINLPGSGIGTASISSEDDRTEAFLTFMSFDQPRSIYRFDLADKEADYELWARPEVPVDPSTIVIKQEFYESKDGTRVPMFIVHKRGIELDGDNPAVIYGYGGFNSSMTPWFSATRFPWYEMGGVYVVANLRGGSEYGEQWHRAGMLENKQNVFDDLIAAAEFLIEEGYTSPEHLAIQGGSNGGLLTGAVAVQRPDLFAAAISAVPLLDMLRYHQFLMAKFWVPEYGSPDDPEAFRWLRAYSPYHNVKPGVKYPAMFFTAGENDNRVHPLHARKMVAKMQRDAANDFKEDPILLWIDREGGHGAGKPLKARIQEVADQMMFLAWQTGMLDAYLKGN